MFTEVYILFISLGVTQYYGKSNVYTKNLTAIWYCSFIIRKQFSGEQYSMRENLTFKDRTATRHHRADRHLETPTEAHPSISVY